MKLKEYRSPKITTFDVNVNSILTSSAAQPYSTEDNAEITVNLSEYGFIKEPNEKILVAHGNCKIMKNGGRQIGDFFGKEYFIAQEDTLQNLICCVTTKRVVLIPQDNKANAKKMFSISASIAGIDWISKKIAISTVFDKWLEYSVELKREEIDSALLSTIPVGNIVNIKLKNDKGILYLGTSDIGHSMDISASIHQPDIFINKN